MQNSHFFVHLYFLLVLATYIQPKTTHRLIIYMYIDISNRRTWLTSMNTSITFRTNRPSLPLPEYTYSWIRLHYTPHIPRTGKPLPWKLRAVIRPHSQQGSLPCGDVPGRGWSLRCRSSPAPQWSVHAGTGEWIVPHHSRSLEQIRVSTLEKFR